MEEKQKSILIEIFCFDLKQAFIPKKPSVWLN